MLEIDGLSVHYATARGAVQALDDVSFDIPAGGALGLVGESGSGKSTVALALLDLLGPEASLSARRFSFADEDLLDPVAARRQLLRGDQIAMVFQDPSQALNPAVPVGRQIAEPLMRHRGLSRAAALGRAEELLADVGLPRPREIAAAYPHQLSGGMKQRALIAAALGCEPRLLVLDEPTTALDVTIEAQILDLLEELRARLAIGLLFVSHNLGVIERVCDEVAVLYAGRLVERAPAGALFDDPRHPYTRGLLGSLPRPDDGHSRLTPIPGAFPDLTQPPVGCIFADRCAQAEARCASPQPMRDLGGRSARCWQAETPVAALAAPTVTLGPRPVSSDRPLLVARDVTKVFRLGGPFARNKVQVNAVDHVSIELKPREVLGLVGESGCGKSTLGRCVLRLIEPDGATLRLHGHDLLAARGRRLRHLRKNAQMVFQNPDSSLNPRKTVRQILRRPLILHGIAQGKAADQRVEALLALVRLPPHYAERYAHQLSGGEKQRVSIARALATEPKLIVLDEPTSALDVSVQAAILNLLSDLRDELGIAYLLISHDMAVIGHLADRIAVMYRGALVELGPAEGVLRPPYHPYTGALLSAVPIVGSRWRAAERIRLPGGVIGGAPTGCRFSDRCPRRIGPVCDTTPPLATVGPDHTIRCHLYSETTAPSSAIAAAD
jgi:peptide/nickel transport system ATP-binding protein